MIDDGKRNAAMYASWTTFSHALDTLSVGLPNVIDRSVFPGKSGGVQAQLLAGMRFLGLLHEDGRPTEVLKRLAVDDKTARQDVLREVLQQRYAALFALNLDSTTPAELNTAMAEHYSVSGDTKVRAVRFFLAAAKFTGISLSSYLTNGKASSPRPSRRSKSAAKKRAKKAIQEQPTQAPGTSMTVALSSGGSLTVSASLDMFSLSSEDRKFVFELIDKLKDYESTATAAVAPTADSSDRAEDAEDE